MSAPDIPLLIVSDNARSERRVSPSWTITHLKDRLEPITGIPATAQRLTLKVASWPEQSLTSENEEATQLSNFPLQAYAEIHIHDTRPPSLRTNYTDLSQVEKYTMPTSTYESLTQNTVLSYKRTHQIGRFDPNAPTIEAQRAAAIDAEIADRNISVGARCQLLPAETDARRGTVAYVGDVEEIPGVGKWVGVVLDEPTGKNDGRVGGVGAAAAGQQEGGGGGRRYFECGAGYGVFVRPERVEVGDFEVVDEFADSDEEF